ncbi:hypothetical protein MKW94_009501 [Papaver nudicaule]|uniref:N-acetyltransferase domain-containing protein n=1 Tax=Papaver nudicaule TaxID=74823 RepID=A0AA41SIT5_PAPNU|nr:hypothetical protein [Papaver nudicaule]
MCIIAVRKYGENERNEMLEDVIGTLNFSGETYPEEVVTKTKIKTSKSKQRKLQKYGIISKIAVAKSARRQGVGSSMLKFAIEAAKDKGIEQVFLYVNGDNKPALALCEKMGVPILDNKEEPKIQEHEELRLRTLISSDKQLKKVSGGELKRQEISISVATHDIVFWSSAFLRSGLSEDESHPRKFIHYCHGTKHSSSESVLGSPATMGFHPKSLHFLTCHGFSESSCKPVSHKKMKFCPVLFAQPRESGNFPSGDEDIQEHNKHSTSISSDDVKEEQSKKLSSGEVKKLEFEVREAATPDECWASTCLRAEEFYKEQSNSRNVDALKQKNVEQEYEKIYRGYARRSDEPFMCFVAVRNVDENVNGKNVIGTLNFRVKYNFDLEGKNYPEALVKPEMPSPFRNGGTPYGVFTRVAVDKSARRQGVAGRMLKFVIGIAKQKGIPEVYLHVRRDNTAALRLYEKLGFTKIEEATPVPYLETHYVYLCRMIL